MPKALKSCPKFNESPNLVTLCWSQLLPNNYLHCMRSLVKNFGALCWKFICWPVVWHAKKSSFATFNLIHQWDTFYGICNWPKIDVYSKNGPTRPFYVYFLSFQTQILQNNCRLQWDSNSDRWSWRLTTWTPPLPEKIVFIKVANGLLTYPEFT